MDHMEYEIETNEICSMDTQTFQIKKIQTEFTNLSYDIFHEIFDYLSLGDIYYTFYHLNKNFSAFIDNTYTCLNISTMSFRHFQYYQKNILLNNIHHCKKIKSIKLSNEQSFDPVDEFYFCSISLYPNLKKLYLYLPNESYLENLSRLVPNLVELYLIPKKQNNSNINWLSSLKNLEICSITPKSHGIEISNRMRSLSSNLTSLSMTLLSTYDFYILLPCLPTKTLRCLNISLFDCEFSYMKTYPIPITLATKLTDFTLNLSIIPIQNPLSLYNALQFVTNLLRNVTKLTILCRFVNGIQVDEEKLRHYLSFAYSVKELQLFIEMNNPTKVDEKAYAYPFWIDKNVHVNVYRNENKEIQRIHIYTLPLTRKFSILSNIHQFQMENSSDVSSYFSNNLTLTHQRIYSSSDICLLYHLPNLTRFYITNENQIDLFFNLIRFPKTFSNIRHLQIDSISNISLSKFKQIACIFPCLRSIFINQINEYEIFERILSTFLKTSPNQQSITYLRISGTFFNEICPTNLCTESIRTNLSNIFAPLFDRSGTYVITLDRTNRTIHFWF